MHNRVPTNPWSLRLRVGLALAGITALALFSMMASILIAETARGDAAVINQAGSLRMQSYRLASLLETEADPTRITNAANRFGEVLQGEALQQVITGSSDTATRLHATISARWQDELQPMLIAFTTATGDDSNRIAADFLAQVDGFVETIDEMVRQLQRQAETRIQLLRLIQGVAIFLTVILVFATMYLLHSGIAGPLQDLMLAADRARRGDLSVRASHTAADEIGLLGASFNSMAEHLQLLYADLEQQVQDKTRELRLSNQSLTLLYDAARTLTLVDSGGQVLNDLIRRLQTTIGADAITVCLAEPWNSQAFHTYSTETGSYPPFCNAPQCGQCLDGIYGLACSVERPGIISVPMISGEERHGVLLIQHSPGEAPDGWKLQLAEAMAERIASAAALTREARQQRRLALMEERAIIARELHDSLAQSLSYLKIQVTRLQTLHRQHGTPEESASVLAELREGLNTAYRHLRELLTTFRLKMNEAGLGPALQSTVEEFQQRGDGLDIRLDIMTAGAPLDADTEIHLLQITREALANVVNHAHASEATVALSRDKDDGLRLVIEDNGIGLPKNYGKSRRYGMHIMQERAQTLGGRLSLDQGRQGGTRVEVYLPGSRSHNKGRLGVTA